MVSFAFILGTGRCGSTLVHDVLARHPEIGFVSNVDDLIGRPLAGGRWNGTVYRRVPPAMTNKGRLRFAPSEGYRILEKQVSPALVAPVRDLAAADATPWLAGRFAAFFDRQARAQDRPVFLHKFTGWPRAGFIDAALPDTRFVHVVRDGRAVANSLVQMPWWDGYRGPSAWSWGPLPSRYEAEWVASDRSFPVLAALEWKILIDAFEAAKAALPSERWHEVRYEDVLEDPRGRFQEILGFLGLSWTDGFERSFARYAFGRDRAAAYRQELGPRDLRALDRSLGEHLERLGYPVSAEPDQAVSA
jgi:omega-hydroxy-beta-dihydromenaquinone-9 sulfotransferase